MPSVAAIMKQLEKLGSEKTRAILVKHGAPAGRVIGVSVADLKMVEKGIRKELGKGREAERQALAMGLYATGVQDAMYLAGMIADGSCMNADELRAWAHGATGMQMIAEYTVAWVTIENAAARALAMEWIADKEEYVAAAGWSAYAGLVTTGADAELDLAEVKALLGRVVKEIHKAPNRVRSTMNGFVIAVGSYVRPLAAEAKVAAEKMGVVQVDVGDTACKVPSAAEYIAKVEAHGKAGVKRKTIRC